jgi:hypothetical protein
VHGSARRGPEVGPDGKADRARVSRLINNVEMGAVVSFNIYFTLI